MRISDWSSDVCSSDLSCRLSIARLMLSDFAALSPNTVPVPSFAGVRVFLLPPNEPAIDTPMDATAAMVAAQAARLSDKGRADMADTPAPTALVAGRPPHYARAAAVSMASHPTARRNTPTYPP